MRPFLLTPPASRERLTTSDRRHPARLQYNAALRCGARAHRSDCCGRQTTNPEDAMHWLWVILIGLVIGALAKLIMPGKDPGGFIVTILLGIAGSIVGTWLGRTIGWYQEGQSAGFLMSVVGALLLLGIYHLVRRRSP